MFLLINKPTRITITTSTLIDNIFTNELKTTVVSKIIVEDLSDHLPIFAICNFDIDRNKHYQCESGSIKDAEIEILKYNLKIMTGLRFNQAPTLTNRIIQSVLLKHRIETCRKDKHH